MALRSIGFVFATLNPKKIFINPKNYLIQIFSYHESIPHNPKATRKTITKYLSPLGVLNKEDLFIIEFLRSDSFESSFILFHCDLFPFL